MQEIYEKLGLFYLGKDVNKTTMEATEALTLLKNKNFTTHAAIIGMTGSGKTGLGVGIIEEAAIDNIPSIVIDPKGDMGDLCLTDPSFSSASFEPWVKDEAKAKEADVCEYAKKISAMWKEGIESSGQNAQRVEKFHQVKKTIYTPGSSAGVAINIMSSLETPPAQIMEDSDTFASYLKSTTTSLLSLVGIDADPLDSKEYILLAQIITKVWLADEDLSIEGIIGKIINPSFKKIGVLPLDDFYPQDARFKLATKFNSLLASPGFSLWLQGDSLDIQKLLYDEKGKAKIAIFSISHLNDEERMFFVTLLLNKYIAWMRQQSGTSALKTLLYMDEIAGFFPPTKNPPSKEPMLLLLKQARAFGIGVVLSTQNPTDLDYKGLSNIGTWIIGRLQTTQDINRVIDGLGGKVGSSFDKGEIRQLLANLKKRTFFLKSAHLDDIRLFTTRWVMSYLKGPLKKDEISTLMQVQKEAQNIKKETVDTLIRNNETLESFQHIDKSIPQYFEPDASEENHFVATLMAKVKVHFYSQRRGIDEERELNLSLTLESKQQNIRWDDAVEEDFDFQKFPHTAPSKAKFQSLPKIILEDKGLKKAIRELKETLYQEQSLDLLRCVSPKLESKVEESHSDFIVRLQDILKDKKESEIEKLQIRYGTKEKVLTDRLSRAKERVEKESSDSTNSMIETGIAVLGALFGKASPTKIGAALRKGSKVLKERGDMSRAEERIVAIQEDMEALEYELEDKIDALNEKFDVENYAIEEFKIKPRKTDIDVELCAVVWRI
ncbi:helicase HerA domain-containing protein [Sulfurovum sp. CS9]|uniref:helicase HerA domain-containing protein n=1 Tax=Sulfurovum sp. CS9 TaxID=3391146 RepID=UPI0039ED23E5